ncbi:leucyl/phenylalanyl-tRNA--protein transferase [Candidatus Colwellia aromaticivorans]|uniref:leucyl/phenylalanyl-tRNA--protein transferase n=1 Tax=Candidatus Colwellia aromaticivorans TaxID=2267621 RepID=UPI000DF28CF5|nr:leucyl/phenylalanyl-tRNA--protein transferase [Candidatus Colwellia aromaticivorans]
MSQTLYQLDVKDLAFPPVELAFTEPNGLLAVGGDLQPQRLINAYSQGIFPWFSENDPLMWWSPNPRAIIKLDNLHINRTLRKALKKSSYKITLNTVFEQVIALCADAPFRDDGTWILPEMQTSYANLHHLGFAHSIEVWQTNSIDEPKLVGGLYGVAINGFFSGESMFYTSSNASKFALVALAELLRTIDVDFIDCQLLNSFLEDMGATEISRENFVAFKQTAINKEVPANFWQPRELPIN